MMIMKNLQYMEPRNPKPIQKGNVERQETQKKEEEGRRS